MLFPRRVHCPILDLTRSSKTKTKPQRPPPSTSRTGRSWMVVVPVLGATSVKRLVLLTRPAHASPAACHPTNTVMRVHRLRCPHGVVFLLPRAGMGSHGCVPHSTAILLHCVLAQRPKPVLGAVCAARAERAAAAMHSSGLYRSFCSTLLLSPNRSPYPRR